MFAYVNGHFVDEESASISVFDLGLLRGYGVFETLRLYQKYPFHLSKHLNRLKKSAMFIDLELPASLEEIEEICYTLIEKNNALDHRLRIIVTAGISPDGLHSSQSSLIVTLTPFQSIPPYLYENGSSIITTSNSRSFPQSKTLYYVPGILALKKAKEKDCIEAIYLNEKKELLEGVTTNFFAFKKNCLITSCSDEILPGITREIVLELAKNHFLIERRNLSYLELEELDEAFITSSLKEIVPITKIDDISIGNAKPGKNTQFLISSLSQYIQSGIWKQDRPSHLFKNLFVASAQH